MLHTTVSSSPVATQGSPVCVMPVYDVPEPTGFGGSVERYLLFVLAIMLGSLSSAGVGLLLGSISSNALVGLAFSKPTYPQGPIEEKGGGDAPMIVLGARQSGH